MMTFGTYRTTYSQNPDGTWTVTVEWENPTSTYPFCQQYLVNHRGEPLTYTQPSMQRTLNEICKDAEYYFDDSTKLMELKIEVGQSQLSESHKGLAIEIIDEKMEALKDNIRKDNARNKLDRD